MSAALQDDDWRDAFIEGEGPRLLGWVKKRVKNAWDAEDITQATFLDFFRSLGPGILVPPSWAHDRLYRIARWRILDHIRARRGDAPLDFEPEDDRGVDAGTLAAMRETCGKLMSVLTDRERTAVTASLWDGADDKDIAGLLGTTPENARKILSRAYQKMRGRPGEDLCFKLA